MRTAEVKQSCINLFRAKAICTLNYIDQKIMLTFQLRNQNALTFNFCLSPSDSQLALSASDVPFCPSFSDSNLCYISVSSED